MSGALNFGSKEGARVAVSHRSPAPATRRPEARRVGVRLAAAAALAGLASLAGAAPADAQFMTNYPVIVPPPPPPAQNFVVPQQRSAPRQDRLPTLPPPQQSQEYHGQTREPVGRF